MAKSVTSPFQLSFIIALKPHIALDFLIKEAFSFIMFTGIVQGVAVVKDIISKNDLKTFIVEFPEGTLNNLKVGASIALNGVCLTVTEFEQADNHAHFDLISKTLETTNLAKISQGDYVNFERAAKVGDEIGGHQMSGHIYQTTDIIDFSVSNNKVIVTLSLKPEFSDYVLNKGFIGINGCSLTIADKGADSFSVHLIPETMRATTFAKAKSGDKVNIEVDPQTQAVVETVKRYMAERPS